VIPKQLLGEATLFRCCLESLDEYAPEFNQVDLTGLHIVFSDQQAKQISAQPTRREGTDHTFVSRKTFTTQQQIRRRP
jgi:hypothetical protein